VSFDDPSIGVDLSLRGAYIRRDTTSVGKTGLTANRSLTSLDVSGNRVKFIGAKVLLTLLPFTTDRSSSGPRHPSARARPSRSAVSTALLVYCHVYCCAGS
jgi:hypothetical protein